MQKRKLKTMIGILGLAVCIVSGALFNSSTVNAASGGYEFMNIKEISDQMKLDGETMQNYVNSSGKWRFGPVFNSDGDRMLTLAEKYCYDRLTFTAAERHDDDTTGDIIFDGGDVTNNTEYYIDDTERDGYHKYAYNPPDGTQIPLKGWKNQGMYYAIHYEGFDVTSYPVGGDKGLIDPDNYGRWATYHGIEFHSVAEVPMVAGEVRSQCYDNANHGFYRNSTAWWPVCAACGEFVNRTHTYAAREAVEALPVLEQGQEIMITCPTCGGFENYYIVHHVCKALSPNRYHVVYDVGTKDPSVAGVTNPSMWYYNFATEYEGKSVENQDRKVAECNFVRPGYTFVGWSTSLDGTVDYKAGATLKAVQDKMTSLENESTVTLYAVWEPNTSYVKVDANSDTFNGGASYDGEEIWTSEETAYQELSDSDGYDRGSANNFIPSTYVVDTEKITPPMGYVATFVTNGGSAVPSITAPVSYSGLSFETEDSNGNFDASTGTYYFGPNAQTADEADIIKLYYEQEPIILPSTEKANECFVGWYEDAAFTKYVGSAGDSYTLLEDTTLYARFATMDVNVADVYYKKTATTNTFDNIARNTYGKAVNDYSTPNNASYAIQNATGAVNLSMQMFTPNTWATVYKPYWKYSGSNTWTPFSTAAGASGLVATSAYNKTVTAVGTSTYTVQSSGFYKLDAYGAQGGNYGSYVGGKGGEAYGTFYLKEGDVLTLYVGGQNGTYGGGGKAAGGYSVGGGYTKIVSKNLGTLVIAGGGGGATNKANGLAGSASAGLYGAASTAGSTGQTGLAGGGGGYQGGATGHVHSYLGTLKTATDGSTVASQSGGCYTTLKSAAETCTVTAVYNLVGYDGGASWAGACEVCGKDSGTYYFGEVIISHSACGHPTEDAASGLVCGNRSIGTHMTNGDAGDSVTGSLYFPPEGTSTHTYGTPAYGLSCGKSETGGYGGSSYISNKVQAGTYATPYGNKTGNGAVYITGVNIGLKDGSNNYVEILGAKMPDLAAPGSVGELLVNTSNKNQLILEWDKPVSNGTVYDFKVEMYQVPTSGTTLTLRQTSTPVSKNLESAIAGYYYIYDNSATTNVATYVNGKYTKPAYTWTNQHYSDAYTNFTQNTMLTVNSPYSYIHVAAVDVAGNIGPTSHRAVATTNLCKITFDTNHLEYQIEPWNTVDAGTYSAVGKTTSTPAIDKNIQDAFYNGYYSVNGTSVANNNRGTFDGIATTLSFGGDFPIPKAVGCEFVGWNSKADGSGDFYSADGSNIGAASIADKELVISTLTGNYQYGQTITLYAIWSDVPTVDGTGTDAEDKDIVKTYEKPVFDTSSGSPEVVIRNGNPVVETVTTKTSDSADACWTNKSSVKAQAQFMATGVYAINQHLYTMDANRVSTIDYYLAGAEPNNVGTYILADFELDPEIIQSVRPTPIWYRDSALKVTKISATGTSALLPDTMYDSTRKALDIDYDIQGSYTVCGSAISRSYAADILTQLGQPGYPGFLVTDELTLKIDATVPTINSYSVWQDSLGKLNPDGTPRYPVEDIPDAINDGLYTIFKVNASDYNDVLNGTYKSQSDSSGILGVYISISDLDNQDDYKVFKMTKVSQSATTDYDNHALAAQYELKVNLYMQFPEASQLLYRIYVVDNAGNVSKALDQFKVAKPDGTTDDDLPIGDTEGDFTPEDDPRGEEREVMGVLNNFSVKTVIYSDEGNAFNVAEGETYFQVGDFGHVDVWTIGYTDSIQLNFGDMGEESKDEIEAGNLLSKYNMGILEDGWTRVIPWTESEMVIPEFFEVYNETTKMVEKVTAVSNPALFNSLLVNDEGVYYAQYYTTRVSNLSDHKWGNDGTSVRIPPYYQLTPDGDKKNEDGTTQYKWELWRYAAIAKKNSGDAASTSTYILWDTKANDVHYRVTHGS